VTAPIPEWAAGMAFSRPYMGSGVLFRDAAGGVLLVRPSYKPGWDIPGGVVEPGESPLVAATRETEEEIGLALPVGGLLVVEYLRTEPWGDRIQWVYDGGVLGADTLARVRVDGEELLEAAVHPVAAIPDLVPPQGAARLAVALEALRLGRALYAEHGSPAAQG
jgi:8-oxo-dGTP pyrophosphatase MutT (NUDIX family)